LSAPHQAAARPSNPIPRAAVFFLVASLVSGLVHMVLTPPFQAPDEAAHFFRAWRVSEGRLDLRPGRERAWIDVPSGLLRAGSRLYGAPPFRAERPIAWDELRRATRVPIGSTRERVYVPNTLQYTFLPYVPQAAGIAMARASGASALGALYAARLANLVVASLLISWAIARLPAYRWLTTAVALTPMAVALRASVSADALALAAACLWVATIAYAAFGAEALRRRDVVALTTAATLLCATKAAYVPLLALVLLVPRARWPSRRRARWAWATVGASIVIVITTWAIATARAVPALRVDAAVDPPRQAAHALAHPLSFAGIVLRDYVVHALRYAAQLVGKLGWLDVPLPRVFVGGYLLLLATLIALDGSPELEVRASHRWLVGIAAAACLMLVSASQYALWTPLGANWVEGVQGRHLLPIAVAAIWAFHWRRWAHRWPRAVPLTVMTSSVVALLVAGRALLAHYFAG
jgi:uncharacterized membrane protein